MYTVCKAKVLKGAVNMRKVYVEELERDSFNSFGFYENMINPVTEKNSEKPIEFFRDMLQLNLGSSTRASFSICRVEPRPFLIDTNEFHSSTGEGILPLDNDILVHVGPATSGEVPFERIRVFKIPSGTMVVLRPGTWHHAPFTLDNKPTNVLVVLPERTYATDCSVRVSDDEDIIYIEA